MTRMRRMLLITAVTALTLAVSSVPASADSAPSTITTTTVISTADVGDGTPTLTAAAAGFSPNDDGTQDTLRLSYETFSDGVQVLEVLDGYGELAGLHEISAVDASQPLGLTPTPAGPGALEWDGTVNNGVLLEDGAYVLLLAVLRPSDEATCTAADETDCYLQDVSASVKTTVLTAKPIVKVKAAGVLYPEHDGYKDSVTFTATMPDAAGARFTIRTAGGTVVRTWSSAATSWSTHWNGKDAHGARVKPGRYRLTAVATGRYGNPTSTSAVTVTVKAGHLVRKKRSRTMVPDTQAYRQLSGSCSGVAPIESGAWRGGEYFVSMALYPDCDYSESTTGLAGMQYQYTLPKAIKYGSIKISGEGKACRSGDSDSAVLFLGYDLDDVEPTTMEGAHGKYATSTMPVSRAADGRAVGWYVAVTNADCYQVRRFVATWSYYVIAT